MARKHRYYPLLMRVRLAVLGTCRFGAKAALQAPCRLLFCATKEESPTLQIYFLRAMQAWQERGELGLWLMTNQNTHPSQQAKWADWIGKVLRPQAIIVSREFAAADALFALAKHLSIPLLYQIDDHLLQEAPRASWDLASKARPDAQRLRAAHYLRHADVTYFSNERLAATLSSQTGGKKVIAEIAAAGYWLAKKQPKEKKLVFGYMGGSGHSADLAMIAPALRRFMEKRPDIRFELFGSLILPPTLADLPVTQLPLVKGYRQALEILKERGWDFAIAPLTEDPFNACKSDVKWVEYSDCGIPGLYSDHVVYRKACDGGAGILVKEGEWEETLLRVADDALWRRAIIETAQEKLKRSYTPGHLRWQIRHLLLAANVASAAQLTDG